jgi:CDP-diacylglycerol--serine O-phosphatidyltransferase
MIKIFKIEDFISILNAVFGFLAIMMLFLDEIHLSFSLILLAILADGLDGFIARKTGNNSQVGDFLEPMGDMLSMGVAPAFLTYFVYQNDIINCFKCHFLIISVLVLFFVCNVIRLSSFFVLKNDNYFVGMPVPASAMIIVTLSYLKIDMFLISIFIVILSIFMVSNIHFKKPWLKLNIVAAVLVFLAIFFSHSYNNLFIWLLLVAVVFYSVFCSVYEKVAK